MKKRKKSRFFVVISIMVLFIIFVGCRSAKTIIKPQPQQVQQLEQKKPELWMQDTYPAIEKNDPITFFNEFEINVTAEIPKTVIMFKDGATYKIDSSNVVSYTIPVMTPGVLIEARREKGQLVEIIVSFDETDQNYNCSFRVMPNKTFTMNANKKITYEMKDYNVRATIKGDGSGLNHLLSNFYTQKSQVPVTGSAAGRNATGTKIISK